MFTRSYTCISLYKAVQSGSMLSFFTFDQLFCNSLIFFTARVITKADLFEGDIVLTPSSEQLVNGNVSFDAVISNSRKWPNAVVPYVFAYNFGESSVMFLRLKNFFELNEKSQKMLMESFAFASNTVWGIFRDCSNRST